MITTYDVSDKTINYTSVENELIGQFAGKFMNAQVESKSFGPGVITAVSGENFEHIIITVAFAECIKRFQAVTAFRIAKSMVLVDEALMAEYEALYEKHSDLTHEKNQAELAARQAAKVEAAKQEKIRKHTEKVKQMSAKAVKDFGTIVKQMKTYTAEENPEFYYGLGWLAKHIGIVSASMPDYLDKLFTKQFGKDAVHTVIDSMKLTSGGHAMKWNFAFKATMAKKADIPIMFTPYLNPTGKAITNTVFLWDLVANRGFKFGKKQDVEAIRAKVPEKFKTAFEEGYNT